MIILFFSNNSSQNIFVSDSAFNVKKSDTIQFIPQGDFKGKCNDNCIVLVANNFSVKTVNGVARDNKHNYSLFIDCPTKYRLRKNQEYIFIAEEFNTSDCTQSTDSLINTKKYKLTKMIGK